ncbi:phage protein D/phage baseplate assembly protein gpV [Actinokineospora baliensis]|uniref:VgrG-related protein n=1 Tax=Actinokineospora baliensis TaxID=547056 RepID=UPI001959C1BD|nr:VgrG-related protein [Actinokineospora baliensis]MBM7773821.1 phage protein D/phage baseplate assembly protein gpV [Actinokineospora baliensis]
MANESFANSLAVTVGGQPLPADVKAMLAVAYVDDSRNLPDMFVLRFRDPAGVVLSKAGIKVGVPVELKVQTADPGGPQALMSGEVTAVGIELDRTGTFTEVRGYDHAHRLFRGRRVAVYPDMTVADVVRKVTSRAGLQAGTIDDVKGYGGAPNTQFGQDNISDWEFLSRLADAVGAQIAVVDKKLNFQLPEQPSGAPDTSAKAATDPLVLEAHRNLVSLRAGVTAAEQVPKVEVRGWDVKAKKAITATETPKHAGIEVSGADPVALANGFGSPPLVATTTRGTQGAAAAMAKGLANEFGSACVELDGVAKGNPKLRAGAQVALANVGEPFAGKYTLTTTRHLFSDEVGYTTEFSVSGRQERSFYGLASGGRDGRGVHTGLVTGVVSDVRDPDKLGRVKVTFPWLADDCTSGWARMTEWGAGKDRGAMMLPEVGDEVVVGFDHGDFDAPFVLGSLHNGKDTVPKFAKPVVDEGSGEIAVRGFVSRKAHKLEFVEADGITIATGDGKFVLALDQTKQVIEITSGKEITVKATNGIKVDAGQGPLELKGQTVAVKAVGGFTAEGATAVVKGQGQAELSASGPVTVKGAIVKIN